MVSNAFFKSENSHYIFIYAIYDFLIISSIIVKDVDSQYRFRTDGSTRRLCVSIKLEIGKSLCKVFQGFWTSGGVQKSACNLKQCLTPVLYNNDITFAIFIWKFIGLKRQVRGVNGSAISSITLISMLFQSMEDLLSHFLRVNYFVSFHCT